MKSHLPLAAFAPPFARDTYAAADEARLQPFFTNLDQSVYVPLIFSPEVIGALCSRASRAAGDLRPIFLNEYLKPFLEPERADSDTAASWQEKVTYGNELQEFVAFLQQHPIEKIFSNPRARSFYIKWLAQYGDDSIAQMAGSHIVFSSLSQIAIKHLEDQRIGLAPIEKSTRYVDYSGKIKGQYMYYTDPTLASRGLETQYRAAMDNLFDTYGNLLPQLQAWLRSHFPEEKPAVIEKKAFDTLRGLLPTSTLSQVAFFGNGQSFEYAVSRAGKHPLGEIRWAGERLYEELFKVTPSFLRRAKDPLRQELINNYQEYVSGKSQRVAPFVSKLLPETIESSPTRVALIEADPDAENKIITGMLYTAPNNHRPWAATAAQVASLPATGKRAIIEAYFAGRTQRWQKVGRALENAYVRFEITMNIGSWTDLHRHRLLTQQRQLFTCHHGYEIPPEVKAAGLATVYEQAINRVETIHHKIAAHDPHLAQYAVTRAHRVRFMQWENLREAFWEIELRTIPEGHPDYRLIEQEKFRLLEKAYPLLAERMHVNMGNYDFARRGQEEKIEAKLRELEQVSP